MLIEKDTNSGPDKFANDLLAPESGVVVFASTTGNEVSLESPEWQNGAFTKAILEGMRGAAARPDRSVISLFDLGRMSLDG